MSHHEDLVNQALQSDSISAAWNDEDGVAMLTSDQDQMGINIDLDTAGYLTLGNNSMPGMDLKEGPVFGAWPGLGLVGTVRNGEGEIVDSPMMGNQGITILAKDVHVILHLLRATLSLVLTSDQTDLVQDTIETLIENNQNEHTPSAVVVTAHKAMEHHYGQEMPIERVSRNYNGEDPTGILQVAARAGVPQEKLDELAAVLQDESKTIKEKMDFARQELDGYGLRVVNFADGVPEEIKQILGALNAAGAMEVLGTMGSEAAAAGLNFSELTKHLSPEQRKEFIEKLDQKLQGKDDKDGE